MDRQVQKIRDPDRPFSDVNNALMFCLFGRAFLHAKNKQTVDSSAQSFLEGKRSFYDTCIGFCEMVGS